MATKLVKKALEEVLPGIDPANYPPNLIDYVGRLYTLSSTKLSLKPQEEIARYHLCAYLSVERLQDRLQLPEPSLSQIPIAPATAQRILQELRMNLLNGGSPSKSIPVTPSKRRVLKNGPQTPTAVTLPSTPSTSTRKRLFHEGPKTPGGDTSESPSKRGRGRPPGALNRVTLEKIGQSPFQTTSKIKPLTPFHSPNKKIYLSTAEVINFCNKFKLPQDVTQKVVSTFTDFHNRMKHEWALLCGLVALVYNIIHKDELTALAKQYFFDRLHEHQNGNLLRQSLTEWIALIHEFFKDSKWVKQLKFEYNQYSDTSFEIPSMGNMFDVNHIFKPESQYQAWKKKTCEKLQK